MIAKLDRFFQTYSYLIFLLSMAFWLGLSPIIGVVTSIHIIDVLVLSVIDLSAFYFLYHERFRLLSFLLIFVSILSLWVSFIFPELRLAGELERASHFVLFIFITIHLIRKIFKSKVVDESTIYASISGYMMIGIMASILCWFLHNSVPESYNIPVSSRIIDYSYYSYVTMSTLGYGDVLPQTEAAKSLAVFITLIGQFYMTVLVALLIGKFLNQRNNA
ncbi:MAG: potassium channel family protein [Vicingaceae bacterium]